MFGSSARFQKTKGTNFIHSNRDTYQLVVNNSTGARKRGEGDDENSVPDPIRTLESNLLPLLEEVRRIQFQDEVGEASLSQATGIGDNTISIATTRSDPVAINEIVPSDTSSLPHPTSIADIYTRTMLKCLAGYPLYKPTPYNRSHTNYLREGIRAGDVGFIRENGAFDFLFNICPSQNDSINPPNLPNGFTLLESEDVGFNDEEEFAHKSRRSYSPVYRMKGFFGRTNYTCSESEGAILELPEGATRFEAIKRLPFKEFATRYGVEWYRYTLSQGRDIANGSLYLVTSSTKCTHWGIAVVDQPSPPRESLQFVHNKCLFGNRTPKYYWKGCSTFITTIAPNPDPDNGNVLNQCVFLRGYKIKLREDIWNGVNEERRRGNPYMTGPSSSHQTGMTARQSEPSNQDHHRQHEIGSSTRPGLRTREPVTDTNRNSGGPNNPDSLINGPPVTEHDEVILHADFNSSPVHPSDLINAALLSQEPDAKIAITHDDAWCDLLQDIFLNSKSLDLTKIARSYTSLIDEYGSISFEKASDSRSCPEVDTSLLLQRTGFSIPQELNRQQGHGTSDKDHAHILPIVKTPPIALSVVPEVNNNTSPLQRRLAISASQDPTHLPTPQMSGARLGGIDESSASVPIILPADSMPSLQGTQSTVLQEPASTQSQRYTTGGHRQGNHQWLHNYVGRRRLGDLTYSDHARLTSSNRHIWTSTAQLNGTTYGEGQGGTKLESRELAAGNAFSALQAQFGPFDDEM